LFFALVLAVAGPSLADEPSLEKRVAALEREVIMLRARVAELEAAQKPKPAEYIPATVSRPPLREAAIRGDAAKIRELLAEGAPVDQRDNQQSTALHLSALQGHLEATRILLDAQADPNARDDRGFTPLMFAAWMWPATAENARLAQEDLARGRLRLATQADRDLLMNLGADQEAVAHLLLDRGADIDAQNRDGETALILAADRDLLNMVKALLDRGADINHQDKRGETALTRAARMDNAEVVALLLERGADPALENKRGQTALSIALHSGHYDLAPMLSAAADARRQTAEPAFTE
jgi:hypothetical protein